MSRKRNVLISGGSGMIGQAIIKRLDPEKYEIAILSRQKNIQGIKSYQWDIDRSYLEEGAVEFADILIHLAGENIAGGRWTKARKKRILDSRVKSSELLFKAFQKKNKPIRVISASAVGYYGTKSSDKIFNESDVSGKGFISDVVKKWENSIEQFESIGSRLSRLRIGLVISKQGGALQKLSLPFKYGLGAILGSGKQWMPWISLEDLANMIVFLVTKEKLHGVYNAVAPQHINNEQFTRLLANHFNKRMIFPKIPGAALKIFLGKMSSIILEGSRISADKIIADGFTFKYVNLEDLLRKFTN